MGQIGSSPLARGTRQRHAVAQRRRRFIPAGAGNTPPCRTRCRRPSVHPRWRGEHFTNSERLPSAGGSSPLARGARAPAPAQGPAHRFIPAGAGNTEKVRRRPWSTAVHPRWRGEHLDKRNHVQFRYGSSPLARGTRAGPRRAACHRAVHPRWRGEHKKEEGHGYHETGSSPLARGTLVLRAVSLPCSRFIPAGAGNTPSLRAARAWLTVHPRWRGEHASEKSASTWGTGSSPLARGTPSRLRRRRGRRRFIPAGGGNTMRMWRHCRARPVHPRWRGEHAKVRSGAGLEVGSSPLARGTRIRKKSYRAWVRFIPAGAGNTARSPNRAGTSAVHPRWRGEHVAARCHSSR